MSSGFDVSIKLIVSNNFEVDAVIKAVLNFNVLTDDSWQSFVFQLVPQTLLGLSSRTSAMFESISYLVSSASSSGDACLCLGFWFYPFFTTRRYASAVYLWPCVCLSVSVNSTRVLPAGAPNAGEIGKN